MKPKKIPIFEFDSKFDTIIKELEHTEILQLDTLEKFLVEKSNKQLKLEVEFTSKKYLNQLDHISKCVDA